MSSSFLGGVFKRCPSISRGIKKWGKAPAFPHFCLRRPGGSFRENRPPGPPQKLLIMMVSVVFTKIINDKEINMKRLVKRLMRISLFVVLTVSFCFGLYAEKVPPEVFQAAREGLSITPLGLSTKADLDNPTVNHGFQVYTASPVNLLKSSKLSSILTPTGLWRFVVVKESQPVSLITVAQIEG